MVRPRKNIFSLIHSLYMKRKRRKKCDVSDCSADDRKGGFCHGHSAGSKPFPGVDYTAIFVCTSTCCDGGDACPFCKQHAKRKKAKDRQCTTVACYANKIKGRNICDHHTPGFIAEARATPSISKPDGNGKQRPVCAAALCQSFRRPKAFYCSKHSKLASKGVVVPLRQSTKAAPPHSLSSHPVSLPDVLAPSHQYVAGSSVVDLHQRLRMLKDTMDQINNPYVSMPSVDKHDIQYQMNLTIQQLQLQNIQQRNTKPVSRSRGIASFFKRK
jgi:hypothetical protein